MASVVRMPSVLAGATEAAIATWLVAPGDTVAVGDPLAEIETEKAIVEYSAEEAGVVGRSRWPPATPARSARPSRCWSRTARRTPTSTPPWAPARPRRPLPLQHRRRHSSTVRPLQHRRATPFASATPA